MNPAKHVKLLRWLAVVALSFFSGSTTASADLDLSESGVAPGATREVAPALAEPIHVIATARKQLVARSAPRPDAPVIATFDKFAQRGIPQVFLLTAGDVNESQDWYEALLPLRPNGTVGFLAAEDVRLTFTPYRIVVDTRSFELTLWKGLDVVDRFTVGLGTGKTPTPIGLFYLTSLLKVPNPNTIYGTYAYGLSGYSEVLTEWEGGGVVGLHGTNDPSSVGRKATHGCLRMHNADIEKLIAILPLGTPIEIR